MTLEIKHATLNNGVVADDPEFPIGPDEWDEAHTLAGALPIANGGTGESDAAAALAALGGEPADGTILKDADIGVTVQGFDADLSTWAGLTPSANFQVLVTHTFAQMRADLDLEAGTDFYSISAADAAFQPKDSDLTSWAGVTRAAGFDTFTATPTLANLGSLLTNEAAGTMTFLTTPSMANLGAMLTDDASGWTTFGTTPTSANLGALVSDDLFLLSDAELGALAGLTSAADKVPYFTGSGTAALADLSSAMRTFMTTPSSANLASLVSDDAFSLADAELGAIAGLTSAADRLPYFTGSGTAALATFTTAGRNLIDDADASAQRDTLGASSGIWPVSLGGTGQTTEAEALGEMTQALTEDTAPLPSDFLMTYDASADTGKKIALGRSGGLQLLTSGTVSSAATLDIVLTSYTAYRGIKIVLGGCVPVTDGTQLYIRFSTDGGSNYDAGASNYSWGSLVFANAATFASGSTGDTEIEVAYTTQIGNATVEGINGEFTLIKQTSTALWSRIAWQATYVSNDAGQAVYTTVGGGARRTAQDTDAIRFLFNSGNISSCDYAVYGYH